jgi:hypothetical protein
VAPAETTTNQNVFLGFQKSNGADMGAAAAAKGTAGAVSGVVLLTTECWKPPAELSPLRARLRQAS